MTRLMRCLGMGRVEIVASAASQAVDSIEPAPKSLPNIDPRPNRSVHSHAKENPCEMPKPA